MGTISPHDIEKTIPFIARAGGLWPEYKTEPAPQGDTQSLLIPPYFGEMGHEIQYFLGAVEPWLRSGWQIIAKRPEFYPEGTAISCPVLFTEIAKLQLEFGVFPIGFQQFFPKNKEMITSYSFQPRTLSFSIKIMPKSQNSLKREREFLSRLESLIQAHFPNPTIFDNAWGKLLLSPHDTIFEARNIVFIGYLPLPPSYKPAAFVNGTRVMADHVGLQLRNYGDPGRNSDVAIMLKAAKEASLFLKLPLIIYGDPAGTVIPDGFPNSNDLAKDSNLPLLTYEMKALRHCKLMLSPLSGWLDLMAWLQIPTLVETNPVWNPASYYHYFTRLAIFKPSLAPLIANAPLEQQIMHLLARPHHIRIDPPTTLISDIPILERGFANSAYR